MAIGTVEFDLSLKNPENGEYLTARTYTVEGVNNVDGTPRQLSIGQLVMAICLQRASRLENGYTDPVTNERVPGIIDLMEEMNETSAKLESLTEIEQTIIDYYVSDSHTHVYQIDYDPNDSNPDPDFTPPVVQTGYYAEKTLKFALEQEGIVGEGVYYVRDDKVYSGADILYDDLISTIESTMDEKNSFSQQKMIELQSQTSKRDQTYDMISNVLKSLNTVLVGIANNI